MKYQPYTPQLIGRNLPTVMNSKFVYGTTFSINPAIASPGSYVFSANGLFDPDITGVGHQPRGFDQLMQLYDHYVVVGSKITIRYSNLTANPVVLAIALKDTTTTISTGQDFLEGTRAVYKIAATGNAGQSAIELTHQCNPVKFLGRSDPLADSELKGSASANPSEGAFYHVQVFAIDGADIASQDLTAQIEYMAKLIEPKQPPIS